MSNFPRRWDSFFIKEESKAVTGTSERGLQEAANGMAYHRCNNGVMEQGDEDPPVRTLTGENAGQSQLRAKAGGIDPNGPPQEYGTYTNDFCRWQGQDCIQCSCCHMVWPHSSPRRPEGWLCAKCNSQMNEGVLPLDIRDTAWSAERGERNPESIDFPTTSHSPLLGFTGSHRVSMTAVSSSLELDHEATEGKGCAKRKAATPSGGKGPVVMAA